MIDAVAYDRDEETLYVRFHNGAIYRYFEVPERIFQGLLRADSKGRFFWRYIRDIYDYEQIE